LKRGRFPDFFSLKRRHAALMRVPALSFAAVGDKRHPWPGSFIE
jgi:hypothetical protein